MILSVSPLFASVAAGEDGVVSVHRSDKVIEDRYRDHRMKRNGWQHDWRTPIASQSKQAKSVWWRCDRKLQTKTVCGSNRLLTYLCRAETPKWRWRFRAAVPLAVNVCVYRHLARRPLVANWKRTGNWHVRQRPAQRQRRMLGQVPNAPASRVIHTPCRAGGL